MARGRRTTTTMARYIAIEFVQNFLICFFFVFVMFLVNQLLLMVDTLLKNHIPMESILKMLFYYTPYLIGMTFPFATLVGCLMTIGRFSSDNEIQALRASGIRYIHIFRPLLIVSLVLFGISLSMNSYFMYVSAKRRNQLMFDIVLKKPEVMISPNSNTAHENLVIYAGDIIDSNIEDLVIIDKDEANNRRVIMAEEARLQASTNQSGVTEVKMSNVLAHSVPDRTRNEFEYVSAKTMIYNILLDKNQGLDINRIRDEDKTIWALIREIKSLHKSYEDKIERNRVKEARARYNLRLFYNEASDMDYYQSQYRSVNLISLKSRFSTLSSLQSKQISSVSADRKTCELYRKLFMPVGCIIMTFFAFPLGMFAKRSGKSVGFIIGVILSILYWFLFMIFFVLARKDNWAPPWVIWIPNMLLFFIGNILYMVRLKQ